MAPFQGFLSGTYQGFSAASDSERCINFVPERVGSEGGAEKSPMILLSRPGLALFSTLPLSPVTGLFQINGRAFAVSGGGFYELLANGSYLTWGYVGVHPGPVQFAANQTQILIVTGGFGFIFNLLANTLVQITAAGWIAGATLPTFIDGYFIILEPASQLFAISALNDGTQWSLLDFGDAEGAASNVVGMIADHRQLWLLASDHSEVYYDAGVANFPFVRLEGAFMQQGCSVGATVVKVDNTILWVGADEKGDRIVWRAQGYTPLRVSNHSVEAFLQGYPRNGDETAYPYQEGGHTFYRLDFPSAPSISGAAGLGATWLYDLATGLWHERGYWNAAKGVYQADLARSHCFAFAKHLVGDYQSGNVYVQSMSTYTDNGAPIRRVRSAPDLSNGGKFAFYSELRLLAQTGVGLIAKPPASVSVPGNTPPWLWSSGFNAAYGFGGFGLINGPPNPVILPGLLTGQQILVQALSGTVTDPGSGTWTANGDLADMTGGGYGGYGYYPSHFAPAAAGKIALIGAFTDGTGKIVSVVNINLGPTTLTVPAGATQLQLGVNDNYLNDDTGAFLISVGLALVQTGVNPQIVLQCSNDGGFTWGIERETSLGKLGAYSTLVRWRRLGRSNNRAFKVICSEPVFVALIAADLDAS